MLKTKTVLEVKISDRLYSLELDPQSPLGEIYDALNHIRGFIIEKINAEQEASRRKVSEEKNEQE